MSAPFIGSRISLISKSDVRYEGILCGIDTNESKVYLQHVRCFGTEDRRKENPIAPATEVYEVIIFHSSDIKDLSVCELPPPVAYDPMSFNSFSHMGSGGYPPQYGYPPMVHPQYGPQYGYPYGPYGHNYGMGYPQSPSMMGPQDNGAGFPPGEQGNDKPASLSVQPPQKINVTTSKVEQAAGQAPSSDSHSSENRESNNDAQSHNADNNDNAKAEVTTSDDSHSQKSNNFQNKNQNNNQNKRNNNRNNNFVYLPKGDAQRNNQVEKSNDNSSNNNAQQTSDSSSSSAPSSNADHQNNRHNNHNNQSDYRQKRGNSNNRGYKNHYNNNNNRRGGFDSRSHHNSADQSHFHKPKEQNEPRSQEDFDFAISNLKFEKLSISALPGELEKELPKISPSYNKDSFYDSISCDTLDREDQKDKKSYYDQRKLDSETFGDLGRRNNNNRGRTRGRYDSHSQNNQNNYSGNHSNNQKRYNNNYNNNNRGNRNYRGNKNVSGNTSNTSDNTAQN